jgi:hypothetical protein
MSKPSRRFLTSKIVPILGRNKTRSIVFGAAAMICLSMTGWGQDTATIVGTVTDASGAVVPNALVSVANPDKGLVRDLTTNTSGEYTAAKIPIGSYVITAEAPGFRKLVRSGISLDVGQTLRVDLQLTLGTVAQEVTVKGSAPGVETETAALSTVVGGRQISNLELNGRNFTNLAILVPGAIADNSYDSTQVGLSANAAISFNGNRMQYGNSEIDGANNADPGAGATALNVFPSLDSIAEFKISTSNYGAEVGEHAGATMEVATKSGTREFHGDFYDYLRNDALDANDWFANRQLAPPGGNAPKTPLKWNDFGYTFGGPFYIPGHYNTDKNKTFFFWNQEWHRYREGTVINTTVPTMLMREGNFSQCDTKSANYNPIVASGCTLPTVNGATVDTVSTDPNAQALLAGLVPLPNNGVQGYLKAPTIPTNWNDLAIRVDQNISERTTVFFRWSQDSWNNVSVGDIYTSGQTDTTQTAAREAAKNAVLHAVHNFKPNLMNEFIMGYSRDDFWLTPGPGPDSVAGSNLKPASWTANELLPQNNDPRLPYLSINGGIPFNLTQSTGFVPPIVLDYNKSPNVTAKDNVIWTLGKHTLKFGVYFHSARANTPVGEPIQGEMFFNTSGSNTTGNALADMFLGRIQEYTQASWVYGHWRGYDFEPYVQDDWKVTRRLTLNIGIRFSYFIPWHDVSNPTIDVNFLPTLYNPNVQALLDTNGNLSPDPTTGQVNTYANYGNGLVRCGTGSVPVGCQHNYLGPGPRFGFAYDPTGSGKTAIRGGYGIYYDWGNGNESNTFGSTAGNGTVNPPVGLTPAAFNVTGYSSIVPGPLGPTNVMVPIPLRQDFPSSQQFSLGIQREFPGSNLLSVSYVGNLGRHLARARNLNQVPLDSTTEQVLVRSASTGAIEPLPDPACDASGNCNVQDILIHNRYPSVFFVPYRGFGTMGMKENSAISNYNALQASFRHAFAHGLPFEAAYSWSHLLDDSTSTYLLSGVDDYHLSRWYGTGDLNRTQVLTINYVYDLPFAKTASNPLVKRAFGGWRLSGISSFFTGEPLSSNPLSGTCGINGFSSGIGAGVVCNSLGPVKIDKGITNDPQFGPTPTWFNPNMLAQPLQSQLAANGEPGMFGYVGRNFLTGPVAITGTSPCSRSSSCPGSRVKTPPCSSAGRRSITSTIRSGKE